MSQVVLVISDIFSPGNKSCQPREYSVSH